MANKKLGDRPPYGQAVVIRIPSDLYAEVSQRAKDNVRTMAGEIVFSLRRLKELEQKLGLEK